MKKLILLSASFLFALSLSAQIYKQTSMHDIGQADIGYGESSTMDGSSCIVGAKDDDSRKGSLFLYYKDIGGQDNWGFIKKIKAPTIEAGGMLGGSVSLSGNYAIAGATGVNNSAGAAYIFARDEGGSDNWGQIKELIPSSTNSMWYYGSSVSILDDIAAVGSRGQNGGKGAVYIYGKDLGGMGNWGEAQVIEAPNQVEGQFGNTVLLANNKLIVGATDDGSSAQGLVFVYTMVGVNWVLSQTLTPSEEFQTARFGESIAYSDEYIAIGAPNENGQGAVFVFQLSGGTYTEIAQLDPINSTESQMFGESVTINNKYLIIGAPFYDGDGVGVGGIFFYTLENTQVQYQSRLAVPADAEFNFQLGTSLAHTGDYLVVPAPNYNLDYSIGYFYKRNTTGISLIEGEEHAINVFPNPANPNQILSIDCAGKQLKTFKIMDISGKCIFEKGFDASNQMEHIQLPQMNKGSYLIEINTQKGKQTQALMIQ